MCIKFGKVHNLMFSRVNLFIIEEGIGDGWKIPC
jgi:hypothetical protein